MGEIIRRAKQIPTDGQFMTFTKETAMPKRESKKPAAKTGRQPSAKKRVTTSPEPTREDIERRAYEIYLERGGTEGCEMEDWLQAERELRQRNKRPDTD
jgi:hypothetical protein